MQTQITCPNCGTNYTAQIFQVIDAQRQPELKQMLLSGSLNVAVCPNCQTATQLAAPLVYHDAEHELLMAYVPMELNLPMQEQEQLVGQLTKVITDNTPSEQFRAYMLQPQTVMTMQTFMEKVYETEGITPEMMERQRQQMTLLQEMVSADKETSIQLIKDNEEMIDETFFALLQSAIQGAMQAPNGDMQMVALSNLQARLYTMTEAGRRLEKRQAVLHQFRREVEQEGGLSHALFVKYLLENKEDGGTIDALIRMGQQALSYELFGMLTEEIEKAKKAGDEEEAEQIAALRKKLLDIYNELRKQSQKIMDAAQETLDTLLQADDKATAVRQNLGKIDEAFMYLLSARIAEAERKGRLDQSMPLKEIQELIIEEAEKNIPPEIRTLNQLLRTEDEATQREIIQNIPPQARPQYVEMLQALGEEMSASGDDSLDGRVQKLQAMLAAATT